MSVLFGTQDRIFSKIYKTTIYNEDKLSNVKFLTYFNNGGVKQNATELN